jgi:transketolase
VRNTFVETLCSLAETDERIWLLCGDLGFSVLEVFASRFPDRYVNVGVAEQNMTGLAAGLASTGKVVFTYSIANFPVMRCLEQIRNDVCYHKANVKIVAVGGGLAYGPQGYTHHGVEDLAVTRVLPNMTVIAPADPVETRLATKAILNHPGPCYLRLGKAKEPIIHAVDPIFEIGKAIPMRKGKDLTIITTGGVLELAIQAAEELVKEGIDSSVLSMPTVQPVDAEAILRAAEQTQRIITVEEHGLGGLSAAVAEVLLPTGLHCGFTPMHLPRQPFTHAGSQEVLRAQAGITPAGIVEKARALLRRSY